MSTERLSKASAAFAEALVNLLGAIQAADATDEPAPSKTRARKTAAPADPAPSPTTQPAAATAATAATPQFTAKQVADLILSLASEKGRDAAVGVLKHFGASRVSDLKPEQYADAYKLATQALEAQVAEQSSADSLV